MRRIALLVLCCFCFTISSYAQLIEINLPAAYSGAEVKLEKYFGQQMTTVDSAVFTKKNISFNLSGYSAGFYRVSSRGEASDFIIANPRKGLALSFNGSIAVTNMQSSDSVNTAYVNLRKTTTATKAQLGMLVQKISADNDSSAYYRTEYETVLQNYRKYIDNVIAANKQNLLGITAIALAEPKGDFTGEEEKFFFMQDHFFDLLDFSNPLLSQCTVLPNMYMRYFEKYVNYDEPGFKKAIDLILSRASANTIIYELSLDFLLKLFAQAGPQIIFEYVVEQYWDKNSCAEEASPEISAILSLQPGNAIPGSEITLDGKKTSVEAYYSSHELTLLVFWSVNCTHCITEMETLKSVQQQYPKAGILAVHIDTDKSAQDFIAKQELKFDHVFENASWEGPLARLYRVNKTPTIYVLNKKGVILARNIYGRDLTAFIHNFFVN